MKDGRATPVDVLAKNLHLAPEVPFRLEDPETVLDDPALAGDPDALAAARDELQAHRAADRGEDPDYDVYWCSLLNLCNARLEAAKDERDLARYAAAGEQVPAELERRQRAHLDKSIDADIDAMLHGQTVQDLEPLLEEVRAKLRQVLGLPGGFTT